jgi:hypothetical protein
MTTVQELIDELECIEDKSAIVKLDCDHAQVLMGVNGVRLGYITEDLYMVEDIYDEQDMGGENIAVVVLQS